MRVAGVLDDGKLTLSIRDKAYIQMSKDADLIIICIDRIHHRISQLTTHHAKRNDRPFAIAATTSNTAVERAIFRALNGNNAYESSGQDMAKYVSAD